MAFKKIESIELDKLEAYSATELCLAARDMLNDAIRRSGRREGELYESALLWVERSLELVNHAYSVCSSLKSNGKLDPLSLDETLDIDNKAKAYAIGIIKFAADTARSSHKTYPT